MALKGLRIEGTSQGQVGKRVRHGGVESPSLVWAWHAQGLPRPVSGPPWLPAAQMPLLTRPLTLYEAPKLSTPPSGPDLCLPGLPSLLTRQWDASQPRDPSRPPRSSPQGQGLPSLWKHGPALSPSRAPTQDSKGQGGCRNPGGRGTQGDPRCPRSDTISLWV